jgi:hypothetical protein
VYFRHFPAIKPGAFPEIRDQGSHIRKFRLGSRLGRASTAEKDGQQRNQKFITTLRFHGIISID